MSDGAELEIAGVDALMGDDGKKKTYLTQNAIICMVFSAPLVATGYASHAVSMVWLLGAFVWILMLALFFSYCPDDDEDKQP
jgi:hypothetical protein